MNWRDVPDPDPTDDDEDVPCPGYIAAVLGFDPDDPVDNSFCPTGKGGGVDATCGRSLKLAVMAKLVNADYARHQQLAGALKRCTGEALRRLDANTSSITVHKDTASVDAAYSTATGDQDSGILGYYLTISRQLHFDGLGKTEGVDTAAHELGHAIDGPEYELSRSKAWRAAYRAEIDLEGDPLSEYARMEPCEGFAEYARLVLTGRPGAAERFPRCYAFWRERGLV